MQHLSMAELEAGLEQVLESPSHRGTLELIVARPQSNERAVLEVGELSTSDGLLGDNWRARGTGAEHLERQITIMNSRAIALVAGAKEQWPLAGDQLYLDLDLSQANLPVGTRLSVGSALLEVTEPPHTGCKKFVQRFGLDAMMFVNSPRGRALNLRGINARVVRAGTLRTGDEVVVQREG